MCCYRWPTNKNTGTWHLCPKLSFFHSFSKEKEGGSRVTKQYFNKMEYVQLGYCLVLHTKFRK